MSYFEKLILTKLNESVSQEGVIDGLISFITNQRKLQKGKYKFTAPFRFKEGNKVIVEQSEYSAPFDFKARSEDPVFITVGFFTHIDELLSVADTIVKNLPTIVKRLSDAITNKTGNNDNQHFEHVKRQWKAIAKEYRFKELHELVVKTGLTVRGDAQKGSRTIYTLKSKEAYQNAVEQLQQYQSKYGTKIKSLIKYQDFDEKQKVFKELYQFLKNADIIDDETDEPLDEKGVWGEYYRLMNDAYMYSLVDLGIAMRNLDDVVSDWIPNYLEMIGLKELKY